MGNLTLLLENLSIMIVVCICLKTIPLDLRKEMIK